VRVSGLYTKVGLRELVVQKEADRQRAEREREEKERQKQRERFRIMRENAARHLENARMLWRDGLADYIRINLCEDHNTCEHCRQRAQWVIPIAGCTLDMVPPFVQCKNERLAQSAKILNMHGCRCHFTEVLKPP
jgi:hypothetical protein